MAVEQLGGPMRFVPLAIALLTLAPAASARTLMEYKHYRALSIDLLGRMPTREELAAFEKEDFDLDRFIDQKLDEKGYTERLTRIWMDTLRLELSPVIQLRPPSTVLRRVMVQGPDGPLYVYFRPGQRRAREATDGDFCFTRDEDGITVPNNNKPQQGTPKTITKAILDANTTLVKPWWLYRDFRSATPVLHYGTTWTTADAGFEPADDLLIEADGKGKTTAIRVCKEEANAGEMGTVGSGKGPLTQWAKQHKGEAIACRSGVSHAVAKDCGCGAGLERCMPWEGMKKGDSAFVSASRVGLGVEQPFDRVEQSASEWQKLWLAQEAVTYLSRTFRDDRDFREVLTGRGTWINGPLAQFYRSSTGPANGRLTADESEPLFDPAQVPAALLPHDLTSWERVESRGPRAAGLLTMPVFLEKYASRRARGAAIYSAFLCKTFVASPNQAVMLAPSNDPNLMTRPGCSTCHATLEPLAAWFARVGEGDYRWLPVPLENPKCKLDAFGRAPGACRDLYDPAFSTKELGLLRGAYASKAHADAGPLGVADEIAKSPELASCVVERVTSGFLGRPIGSEDAALVSSLKDVLLKEGYRMRPLVRALVKSKAYREANDLASDAWRAQ